MLRVSTGGVGNLVIPLQKGSKYGQDLKSYPRYPQAVDKFSIDIIFYICRMGGMIKI